VNPGRYNITVYQGTTFQLSPVWKVDGLAVNLTGYTADMQVRDINNNLITELSTGNGRAVITAGLGQIALTLTATQTAALSVGNYNYALNLTDSASNVYQILQGAFILNASVVQ
jgi:hypothetical protein